MATVVKEYQRKQDGRWFVILSDHRIIPRAHYVWLNTYPNDSILSDEVIHHKDENKENDAPNNLRKMTSFKHKSLHSNYGTKSLAKWKRENPKKASKLSQKNANKMREIVRSDPIKYEAMLRKKREGTIRANKARKLPKEELLRRRAAYMRKYRKRKQKEI